MNFSDFYKNDLITISEDFSRRNCYVNKQYNINLIYVEKNVTAFNATSYRKRRFGRFSRKVTM